MKKIVKTLLTGTISIGSGFFMGYLFLSEKDAIIPNWNQQEKYFFIEEGIYSSYENIISNLSNIREKVIDYDNKKYYVYLGITKDRKNANRLLDLYQKKGLKVHLTEKYLNSEEFLQNVLQFDSLMKEKEEDDEIITIESVVLANYEEIFKKE